MVDFGDFVVHVMHEEARAFYRLERLWNDCPAIDLQLPEHMSETENASEIQDASETEK